MKNIHVLPTDKPSRLRIGSNFNFVLGLVQSYIVSKNDSYTNRHIYITSDEEIKEDDYMYDIDGDVGKAIGSDMKEFEGNKKIILTTDQDLIKDGVQDIDNEFLEWFVKNPSCEEVAVGTWSNFAKQGNLYHIIIPKEEQKQHLIDIMRGDEELGIYEEPKQIKCYCGHTITCDCGPLEEPKQERMYSEEESIQKIIDYVDFQFNTNGELDLEIKKWFEQFKKK